MSPNPALFTALLHKHRLPPPTPELRFHPKRRWRFDFAWPAHRIALEVEGGVWTGGRHTSSSGFLKDMEKYNAAALLGWRVLRCEPKRLLTQDTVDLVREALMTPRDP